MDFFLKTLLKIRHPGLVLFGHGVTLHKNDPFIEKLHLDFNQFAAIIDWYQKIGFHFISMDELIQISQKKFSYPAPWIHLTFDDGYRNNFTVIHPFLREKKIPWSVFVSTRHIAENERFYTYRLRCALMKTTQPVNFPEYQLHLPVRADLPRRIEFIGKIISVFKTMGKSQVRQFMHKIDALLSPEEWTQFNHQFASDAVISVAELKELGLTKGVHVGSHGHNHFVLNDNLSVAEIADEMEQSKRWLETTLQSQNLTFCYPNGKETDFSERTRRISVQNGYRLGFTAPYQPVFPDTDPQLIPRISFPETMDFARHQLLGLVIPDWIKQTGKIIR